MDSMTVSGMQPENHPEGKLEEKEVDMSKIHHPSSRRTFLTKALPGCAVACVVAKPLFSCPVSGRASSQEEIHKFEKPVQRVPTNIQMTMARYGDFVRLARALEKEMGKEKLIEFLKETTTERGLEIGKNQASRSPDNSLDTYVNQFRGGYENSLTKEIVEDTEKAFELKVTECLWASAFHRMDAGDLGYAWVCFGDYAWARGFNPKIEMVRDKTLMQGHDFCNHRYIWKG